MIKQLIVLAIALAGLLGVAHLTRYEPLGPANTLQMQPVWDRWRHRVCLVFFVQNNRLVCSFESLSGTPKAAPLSYEDQIRQYRAAGFSDQEIVDHVREILKSEAH